MKKFPKPLFYEDEGFNLHGDNTGSGSSGTTTSKFSTKEAAINYMQYCPYPIDYKIIYDKDEKGFRIKFHTGICRTMHHKATRLKHKQNQYRILKATKFNNPNDHHEILVLIAELNHQIKELNDTLELSEWKTTY